MPEWLLNVCEFACLAVLVTGVALIFVPAAFILAGLLGVVAFEFLDRRLKADRAKAELAKAMGVR